MDYQQNARLTVHSRKQIAKRVLDQGLTLKLAAASFNVSAKTAKASMNSAAICLYRDVSVTIVVC